MSCCIGIGLTRCLPLLSALSLSIGCTTTSSADVSLPLSVAGTDVREPFDGRGGWTLTLERADLAFGPLYLCPGKQAGELCDVARAEWLEAVVVDALAMETRHVGTMAGATGPVRSWMYDQGIVSVLTSEEPLLLDAALALDGNSVVIEGVAERNDTRIPFRAQLPIQQDNETERGVPVVRKSTTDVFEHMLTDDPRPLVVRFDPRGWLRAVDFSTVEVPADGDRHVFDGDSQGLRAIHNELVAGTRPRFEWKTP